MFFFKLLKSQINFGQNNFFANFLLTQHITCWILLDQTKLNSSNKTLYLLYSIGFCLTFVPFHYEKLPSDRRQACSSSYALSETLKHYYCLINCCMYIGYSNCVNIEPSVDRQNSVNIEKSRVQETRHLSTDADSSTDTKKFLI